MQSRLSIEVSQERNFKIALGGDIVGILRSLFFLHSSDLLINDLVEAAYNVEVLVGIVKDSPAKREDIKREDLDFFWMIPLNVEPRKGLHQLSDFKVEIGKACVCHNLSLAVINVKVNAEEDVIELISITHTLRVVCREVLLVLPLKALNSLILSSDANIIEEVR